LTSWLKFGVEGLHVMLSSSKVHCNLYFV